MAEPNYWLTTPDNSMRIDQTWTNAASNGYTGVYDSYFIQVNNTNPPSYHVEYWSKTDPNQPAVRLWARDFSCVDVADPSPTPGDSASPGPSTGPSISPSSNPPGGGGSPAPSAAPSNSPPSSPGPSSSPGAPVIGLESPAFSPNGDGANDGDNLNVTAQGPWSVGVDGHPGELGGAPTDKTGSKSFRWDGRVNGELLPDGKYTLRLIVGNEVKTADVIIDTGAPEVSNVTLEPGEVLPGGKSFIAKGTADITDIGLAGIDPSSIKVKLRGLDVSAPLFTVSPDGTRVSYRATITPGSTFVNQGGSKAYSVAGLTEGNVEIDVWARDRVGNGIGDQTIYSVAYPSPGASKDGDLLAMSWRGHTWLDVFGRIIYHAIFDYNGGPPTSPTPGPAPSQSLNSNTPEKTDPKDWPILNNPYLFRGASLAVIRASIPTGWVEEPTKDAKGASGIRWHPPRKNYGDQIRYMPGNPADPNPIKTGPYLRVSVHGQVHGPIPLEGNPTL